MRNPAWRHWLTAAALLLAAMTVVPLAARFY